MQHDCEAAGCAIDGIEARTQERAESAATRRVLQHRTEQEGAKFIVNLHAFHNARLIRKYLPWNLTLPRALYPDRERRLLELGEKVTMEQAQKQTERTRKAAETRARNIAKKAATDKGRAMAME